MGYAILMMNSAEGLLLTQPEKGSTMAWVYMSTG